MDICRRYGENVKAASPESPFSSFVDNSPIQRKERWVTVSVRNPHIPGKDIATFLSRFCTMRKDPAHILDGNGFWTGKWSVLVKLHRDKSSSDGVRHLPQSFSLGSSPGIIDYPDQPQTCRKCDELGHWMKNCKSTACRNGQVTGHDTKVKAASPESPLSSFMGNSPIQLKKRWVTVSVRNPHTPVKDITTFLSRFCTVLTDPAHILDGNGFWTGKWSVLVKLHRDKSSSDGVRHLPQSFSLGSSPGTIDYQDQPQTCRKCDELGHCMKNCKSTACRNDQVTGHDTKVKVVSPESPFSSFMGNSPIQMKERWVTVSVRNPHTPVKDITTFLSRFCTVLTDPAHILDGNGFWTGKWSVLVKLHRDKSSSDGVRHLPESFSLGSSLGTIDYLDQPQTCRKCGELRHLIKNSESSACRNCQGTGHDTKDYPKKKACNLCGLEEHVYKDCPQRVKTYAAALKYAQVKQVPPIFNAGI
uniref:CCHC-type domain-containing protein n=1 Tax=Xenopus tropicalis TaxID=8364 RepID=A0A803JCJ5_XENTR